VRFPQPQSRYLLYFTLFLFLFEQVFFLLYAFLAVSLHEELKNTIHLLKKTKEKNDRQEKRFFSTFLAKSL
jgi:hypothetical protein